MATLEPLTAASGLSDAVRARLHDATAPLKLAEVAKGLPRPRKVKAADFQEQLRKELEEEVRLGRVFSYPSAKGNTDRYWGRDEKQLLRDKAVELAAVPHPLSALKTALGKEVKGTDGAFIEVVLRELIGDDRLFEHPPKTTRGKPLIGAAPPPPPPPPLLQGKHRKALDKLTADCRKLLTAAGVSEDELLGTLRAHLQNAVPILQPNPPDTRATGGDVPRSRNTEPLTPDAADLDELILKAVSATPVLSLADLRREMPAEFRGRAFDEAVLRLADRQEVIVSQDADPSQFSPAERTEYVQDGDSVFTTIMKRS